MLCIPNKCFDLRILPQYMVFIKHNQTKQSQKNRVTQNWMTPLKSLKHLKFMLLDEVTHQGLS